MNLKKMSRLGAVAMLATTMGACAGTGGLGSILSGVLGGMGGGSGNQVSGSIQTVDTRNQQVIVRQSDGQSVALSYDNSTSVVYNNQNYQVTSLQNGDQVTARVQQLQNGGYYTDLIQVDQSVTSSGATGNAQQIEGTVRQMDVQNGWFTVTANNGLLTVTMPYNARSTDINRFQNLRSGDYVRLFGVYLTNSRVELRQFY